MTIDIFALAYVVAKATDTSKWKHFAEEVLGMMAEPDADGGLSIKMDERRFRIAIQAGDADGYVASGWEVINQCKFDEAIAVLEVAGVVITLGDATLCQQRGVKQLVSFFDPSGNKHELVWGFKSDFKRFVSPVGVPRFVTDGMGIGHTVLPAHNFMETVMFYRDVLGFGLSDLMNFQPAGPDGPSLPIYFMHCRNGRHHSLALAGFPVASGCVHLMVEVETMAEVGRAFDRMLANGVQNTATLGQHTNDRMTSFYMRSPAGFDIEFGYGGITINPMTHITHEFTNVSLWGHDFSIAQPK